MARQTKKQREAALTADLSGEAAEAAVSPAGGASAPTLEQMRALAAEVVDIDQRVAKNQARISELQARRNTILTRELVEMMDHEGARLTHLEIDGWSFRPRHYVHANIPKENPDPGHDWLEKHKAGDLIKNTVTAEFPREHAAMAKKAERYLREHFQMATVARTRFVPWARLTSWLRELILSDDPKKIVPPLDIMGASVGRVVEVKPPRKDD